MAHDGRKAAVAETEQGAVLAAKVPDLGDRSIGARNSMSRSTPHGSVRSPAQPASGGLSCREGNRSRGFA